MSVNFTKMTATLLSQALGRHRATIGRWGQSGCPRNKDGSYSLPAVIEWLVNSAAADRVADADPSCSSPALERLRLAKAAMAEHDLKIQSGRYLEKEEVYRQFAMRAAALEAVFKSGVRQCAADWVRIVDGQSAKIEDLIQAVNGEIDRCLDFYGNCEELQLVVSKDPAKRDAAYVRFINSKPGSKEPAA